MNNKRTEEFENRFIKYSVDIIKLTSEYKQVLPRSVIDQVIRSSSSIGANYAEAQDSSSKADFKNKLYIAKKEANETKYWLKVINKLINEKELEPLIKETQEIILIFQKIINTLNGK